MIESRRRTKIIATIGPASESEEALNDLITAGVDVFRLNFSHGKAQDHVARAELIRQCARSQQCEVAILADLQGPKIRITRFSEQSIELITGQTFTLDASHDKSAGTAEIVGLDYENLPDDVAPTDHLLLDDGRIVLEVQQVVGQAVQCIVREGGKLSNNKGINKKGGGLSAPALTEKDKNDLRVIAEMNVDYVAISFVRSASDVDGALSILQQLGSAAGIVAKIERREALDHIDAIISASAAVMVARGDLGVEIGDAELPVRQKEIIGRARALDKAVITATQMMESMIENAIPTRAEVFDVANAVLDGTDAVMLSAETATGKNPSKVVEAMARICLGAEKQKVTQVSGHRLECQFHAVDEAIAMATMYTANHLAVKAIIALTESGSTPLWMSRIRSGIPIFGLSRHASTLRKMMLYRGVYPVPYDATQFARTEVNRQAVHTLQQQGIVHTGDLVIVTKGDFMGVHGGSNTMKIMYAGAII